MNSDPLIVLALGSNLGPSVNILREIMRPLQDLAQGPLLCSSLWRSSPVDCPPDSPDFINAVVGFTAPSGLTPLSLLDQLQVLERSLGRRPKTVLNEPRPLDLDVIFWGDMQLESHRLILPHPRAHLRRFVLQPLSEIVPDFVWPGLGRTVSQWLALLDDSESLELVTKPDVIKNG